MGRHFSGLDSFVDAINAKQCFYLPGGPSDDDQEWEIAVEMGTMMKRISDKVPIPFSRLRAVA